VLNNFLPRGGGKSACCLAASLFGRAGAIKKLNGCKSFRP
jgi:hypothetical protein